MHAALLAILFLAPCEAPQPLQGGYYVKVDVIVINRQRRIREWEEENWRHELVAKREFSETWWVSFWDVLVVSVPPLGPLYVDFIDRGWWSADKVESLAPCSDGFVIERKPEKGELGLSVIGTELHIIDSPYDWEMRNRRIYQPIQAP